MSRAFLLVATALLLVLSGCAADPSTSQGSGRSRALGGQALAAADVPSNWAELAVVTGGEHDHTQVEGHRGLSTPNFEIVGHNPLKSDWYGKPPGGFGCSKTQHDGTRALSVTSSFTTDAGMILSDVTDPTNPEKLSELVLPWTHVYDNFVTPDLQYVLLATSPLESGPEEIGRLPGTASMPPPGTSESELQPYSIDACTGEKTFLDGPEQSLPYAAGLILVDIENPRVPRIVDFLMFPPLGVHSIQGYIVDGKLMLIGSVFSLSGAGSYAMLLEVAETPNGGKLVPIAPIYPPSHYESTDQAQKWATHDAYIHRHPVTNELLVWVADIYHGVWVVNIDNPRLPEYIAHYDPNPQFHPGDPNGVLVHGIVFPDELWDDRFYVFVEEECYGHYKDTPTCIIFTLDATDPTDLRLVSAWTTPVDLEWGETLQWSLHYAGLLDRTLLISGYHAGIWAVDVSTPEALRTMPTIGVFVPTPAEQPELQGGSNTFWTDPLFAFSPIVWEFDTLPDGTIITYDLNSGLYAVRFDVANPAPSPAPWPFDAVKFEPIQ